MSPFEISFILFFIIGDVASTALVLSLPDGVEVGALKFLPIDPSSAMQVVLVGGTLKVGLYYGTLTLPVQEQLYIYVFGSFIGLVATSLNMYEYSWPEMEWKKQVD